MEDDLLTLVQLGDMDRPPLTARNFLLAEGP